MNLESSALSRIKAAVRREDTIIRLGGDAYIAGMTWTADERQLVAIIDGSGWPELGEYCTSRLFVIDEPSEGAAIAQIREYPDITPWDLFGAGRPISR